MSASADFSGRQASIYQFATSVPPFFVLAKSLTSLGGKIRVGFTFPPFLPVRKSLNMTDPPSPLGGRADQGYCNFPSPSFTAGKKIRHYVMPAKKEGEHFFAASFRRVRTKSSLLMHAWPESRKDLRARFLSPKVACNTSDTALKGGHPHTETIQKTTLVFNLFWRIPPLLALSKEKSLLTLISFSSCSQPSTGGGRPLPNSRRRRRRRRRRPKRQTGAMNKN